MIELLDIRVKQLAHAADKCVVRDETIELVPVNREMALPLVLPHVTLIYGDADEMRHHLRKAVIVVPFHPHDFNATLAIRQLADLGEEVPVIAVQATEIQVGEDVAQKNEAAIGTGFKNCEGISGAADFRSKMDVRQEQRVARLHTYIVAQPC
jgi:hypothetical protein